MILSWSLIHGSNWSILIKAGLDPDLEVDDPIEEPGSHKRGPDQVDNSVDEGQRNLIATQLGRAGVQSNQRTLEAIWWDPIIPMCEKNTQSFINSLAPRRFEWRAIFKLISVMVS